MSNPGMDADVFEQFIEQLERYVRERFSPPRRTSSRATRSPPKFSPNSATWACSA